MYATNTTNVIASIDDLNRKLGRLVEAGLYFIKEHRQKNLNKGNCDAKVYLHCDNLRQSGVLMYTFTLKL